MSHNTQNTHDAADEALTGRYASSIGWDPNRTKPNEREIARAQQRARQEFDTRQALARAIDLRPARELMRRDPDEYPQPTNAATTLFPPYWYPGQLGVITGPPDGTLSLFATQLAELIARSQVNSEQLTVNNDRMSVTAPSLFTAGVPAGAAPRGVDVHSSLFTFYVDLAKTRRQYREIYSHNGRRYRFSANLNFGLLAGEPLPERYKGRREAFYHDAIATKLGEIDEPTVAIIDNLSWLLRSGSPTELRQLLRSFRSHVNHTGNSILLLAHDQQTVNGKRKMVNSSALTTYHSQFFNFADTVFSLNPSTFAPDHFYLKSLKLSCSSFGPTQTLACSTARTPHVSKGTDDAASEAVQTQASLESWDPYSTLISPVAVYKLTRSISPPSLIHHSPITTHHSPGAFPGFQFLGPSSEAEHTRDYAAEIAKFEATVLRAVEKEERRRKLSAKEALAQGYIDGSYKTYLLGP